MSENLQEFDDVYVSFSDDSDISDLNNENNELRIS